MRRLLIASALIISGLSVPASAAPPNTLQPLSPISSTSIAYKCSYVCTYYGYCGYAHNRYKCCKSSRKVCH